MITNTGAVSPPYEFLHNYLLLGVETGAVDAGDYQKGGSVDQELSPQQFPQGRAPPVFADIKCFIY